ncbi:MAG: hypothetical protein JO097_04075, partial [Acidobacteriaceae bacterium]|nr:hypothetical protein [Acidobacteriaceae bacterium]
SGQTISSLFTNNNHLRQAVVWVFAAALLVLYLRFRNGSRDGSKWRDVAFFCALTTTAAYHRYYDAQIFLLLIPLLVELWKAGERKMAAGLGICLLLLAFPSQSVIAKLLGTDTTVHSLPQVILFRHQPLAVIAIALILVLSGWLTRPRRTPDAHHAM